MRTSRPAAIVFQSALCFCLSPLLAAQAMVADVNRIESSDTIYVVGSTEVPLRLEQDVSSASAHKGDRVRLTLSKDLLVDGKPVAPAGSIFYAKVSRVRHRTSRHSGSIRFSNAELNLGNGKRIRLAADDPSDKIGASGIPFLVIGAVTVGPLILATLPISLSYLLAHDVSEHKNDSHAGAAKAERADRQFSSGEVLIYYADHDVLARRLSDHAN
jgi:hypothetical protein